MLEKGVTLLLKMKGKGGTEEIRVGTRIGESTERWGSKGKLGQRNEKRTKGTTETRTRG